MRSRLSSWAVSLFAHGGVAAVLIVGVPWPNPPGAIDEGLQGIEVSLVAGGMAGAKASEPPPPEPEKVVEKPIEPPPPAPQPEPVKAPEVIESKSVQPDIEEAPKPKPKPVAEIPRRAPPKPVQDAVKPAPEPTPQPSQQVAVAPSPMPASPGQSGHLPAPNVGSGQATTSGGNPGAEANYFATLLAWLERHKEYPRRAQMRRIEGVTHLRFTIDGQGHVLRYKIERSSGHETLDEAVERMIKKAEPLPAIPAEIGKDQLEVVVPVQFLLK